MGRLFRSSVVTSFELTCSYGPFKAGQTVTPSEILADSAVVRRRGKVCYLPLGILRNPETTKSKGRHLRGGYN